MVFQIKTNRKVRHKWVKAFKKRKNSDLSLMNFLFQMLRRNEQLLTEYLWYIKMLPSIPSLQGRNEDESRPLCMSLKQFGWCKRHMKCESRHQLRPCDYAKVKGHEDWPPSEGKVKVSIPTKIS